MTKATEERERLEAELDHAEMELRTAGTHRGKAYWRMRVGQLRAELDDRGWD
jgi:hypothetical protein